jgi:ribosomal protein S12 methylthiotransferase
LSKAASAPLSVGFISLGCAKNLVDSQIMAGRLIADGLTLSATPEAADVVVVNTCSFIEDARAESMEMILSACELKKQGSCRAVLVAGCLPQRYRDRVEEVLPDVDAFIGLDDLDRIGEIVRSLEQRSARHCGDF